MRAAHDGFDALNQLIAGVDVDTRVAVGKGALVGGHKRFRRVLETVHDNSKRHRDLPLHAVWMDGMARFGQTARLHKATPQSCAQPVSSPS